MYLWVKFILAFCSLVYELVLAQTLSAFLQNTVLRYSVTVGLYMCSMGLGALTAEGRFLRRPRLTLLSVEILLTFVGGLAVIALYLADAFAGRWVVSVAGHLLIIMIGFLTGFELPLMLALPASAGVEKQNRMIAADYAGALTGALMFAFVFYPLLGLVPTALFLGLLNAGTALVFWRYREPEAADAAEKADGRVRQIVLLLGFVVMAAGLLLAGPLTEFLTRIYLR